MHLIVTTFGCGVGTGFCPPCALSHLILLTPGGRKSNRPILQTIGGKGQRGLQSDHLSPYW